MAKKEEPVSMVDTFAEFKELKNIEITTMISVLEESTYWQRCSGPMKTSI